MTRDFADPRIPNRDQVVIRDLIDRWAVERPDKVYAVFDTGERIDYVTLRRRVVAKAAGLTALGVCRGDHVAACLPTGLDAIIAYFAVAYLGAVFVPYNTAYRGGILAHVLDNAAADILIIHPDLVARVGDVAHPIRQLVLTGSAPAPDIGLPSVRFDAIDADEAGLPALDRPIEPWDIQAIIYTSGTTGPSKGVLSSYLHMYSNAGPESWTMVGEDDRYLVVSPIFHIGGSGAAYVMLARGASIAVMAGYSTDRFWTFARESEATAVFLLGVMATFLLKQPPSAADRDHRVRTAFMVPLTDDAPAFHARFGVDIYTIFNMTEISSPIVSVANPAVRGTCGMVRPGVDVRLVDAQDCEVPIGTVGEMLVRTDRPHAMTSGYHRNAEATAAAWRNGWFHTGDAFRRDATGNYFFVDRIKDSIRRRGENISSFEVEVEVCAHPTVRECAAIGVPSEVSEDEILVIVAPVPGATIDPAALTAFLADRMPYFMVPRYVRVLDELPKTASAKVQKADLRSAGVTADCWDRERAGVRLRREKLAG